MKLPLLCLAVALGWLMRGGAYRAPAPMVKAEPIYSLLSNPKVR